LLSQWRAYAGSAGFAIEFDEEYPSGEGHLADFPIV
jgi:hypothetical protein